MNDLVPAKLKEIINLQNFLKRMSYSVNENVEKSIVLVNILCALFFKRYT